ncbi:MAG: ABC transporter substrate-binding protein [Deltaproteobacteria bacterium]|nr:ABC transporter substrate-binding protein [Deltaproteobacteria bacterium]
MKILTTIAKSLILFFALLPMTVNAASNKLINAAKSEGEVTVYSITSRIANAAKAFEAKYGIKVNAHNLKGFELITKITKEGKSGVSGADFVLAQDSGRVFGELIKPGFVYNYVPEDMANIIPKKFQNPLAFSFITKVFTYNSETYTHPPVTNVWELTDPKWKGKFFFKDPLKEGVNANFLTMIPSPEFAKKLEEAYIRYAGKKLKLTTPNAGYEWIKRIIDNKLVMFTSDTKMSAALGVKGNNVDAVSLGTYSKLRYRVKKNLALMPIMGMEPFAGFHYPSFLLMTKNAKNKNAAMLFIEYLLTEEGFKPWSGSLGTYSSNPSIKPYPGDNYFSVWSQVLVGEDPEFTFENRVDVEDFWNNSIY